MTPTKAQAKSAVRSVVEQVKHVLSQPEIGTIPEADTRANFIDKYIFNLGYDGIGVVVREYYVKDLKEFIDYLLRVDAKTNIVVEAKSLRSDLTDAHAAQLVKYAAIEGFEWCVLTNGREVHIYNQYLKGGVQDKLVLKLDLLAYNSDDEFDSIFDQLWLLSREGMAIAAITTLMEQMTLDRAIRQLIMDPSSATVKAIRSDLKSRFGLMPTSGQIVVWLKDRIIGKPLASALALPQQHPVDLKSVKQKAMSAKAALGKITVRDLADAGLLPAEAKLTARYKGQDIAATVTPGGNILVNGEQFNSPSGAAVSITGSAVNGWRFWSYAGQPLFKLWSALAAPESMGQGETA